MDYQLKPIEEQVVVILGATSGIGRETAQRFAERGAKVVLSGRGGDELQALADEIRQRGGEATAIPADVTEFEQVKNVADRAAEMYGRIDTWVHLAGVSLYSKFSETKPEEFKQIIDVNLSGQAYGAMAALPHLKRAGRGALIHISSVEARRSLPLQSAYAASKRGIPGFLDALRMELEADRLPISVTNIMPAGINTPFFDKALTRLGVKPRPVPPVYEPAAVADIILYAAEHPARDLYVGGAGKGLGLMDRLSPRLADKALSKIGFVGQRTEHPKSEMAPNNLFEHLPGYNRSQGTFSNEARSASAYNFLQQRPVVKWALGMVALAAGAYVSGLVLRSVAHRNQPEYKLNAAKDRISGRISGRVSDLRKDARQQSKDAHRSLVETVGAAGATMAALKHDARETGKDASRSVAHSLDGLKKDARQMRKETTRKVDHTVGALKKDVRDARKGVTSTLDDTRRSARKAWRSFSRRVRPHKPGPLCQLEQNIAYMAEDLRERIA